MSKKESTILKGLAILMMVFLHLFNNSDDVSSYQALVWLGHTPLANIITRSCSPVSIFVILSGYGLGFCRDAGKLGLRSNSFRILKLYIYYWLSLLVFVSIGCMVAPSKYPGTWRELFENIIGISSSYNAETWFLFPYVLLAFSSPVLFRMLDKFGSSLTLIVSTLLYFVSILVIHFYVVPHNSYNAPWFVVVVYFNLLLSFMMGVVLYNFSKKHSLYTTYLHNSNLWAVLAFFAFFCLHFLISFQGMNPFYEFILVILFIQIRMPKKLENIFILFGKYSMPMWLTHTYYCRYLFHDAIYAFKYPLIIYSVLLIVSLLTAWLMTKLLTPLTDWLRSKILCRVAD